MGLFPLGTPLSWPETKQYADHVRKHGILQFIHIYNKQKDRNNDSFKWGDEVEYTLLKFDHETKQVYCNLKAKAVLDTLLLEEINNPSSTEAAWRPEYAGYMVEGIPGKPMDDCIRQITMIEENMKLRRQKIQKILTPPEESVQTIVAFPRLGCPNFTYPSLDPTPDRGLSRSMFYPDEAIFQGHPKFSLMTRNLTERRGSKVAVNIPKGLDDRKVTISFEYKTTILNFTYMFRQKRLPSSV